MAGEPAQVERHPWAPFLPDHTRVLMLGSFPPAPHRWCMAFFYPNYTNDMWRIFGLCLHQDKNWFVDEEHRTFRLERIISMLRATGVGLYDTAVAVRRTRNTASDKDLEVVETTDLDRLLAEAPECVAVVTTGQKATTLFAQHFGITEPKVGESVAFKVGRRELRLLRMPSSSRAYPMKVERKAEYYQPLFEEYLKPYNNNNYQKL